MPDSTPEIDKQQLYGRYDDDQRERVRIQNDRRRWQNQLSKQVTHKALDEPLLDDEAMHVDARRHTTVSHTGLGWKELLLLGVLSLPIVGAAGLTGAGIGAAVLRQFLPDVQSTMPTQEKDASAPADTRIVPRLRFGPEREKASRPDAPPAGDRSVNNGRRRN